MNLFRLFLPLTIPYVIFSYVDTGITEASTVTYRIVTANDKGENSINASPCSSAMTSLPSPHK